jgi:hypothetical protein
MMISTEFFPPDVLNVTYNAPVDESDFDPTEFTTSTMRAPSSATQYDPTTLSLQFDDDISAESPLTFAGTEPGVLTPQTIAY